MVSVQFPGLAGVLPDHGRFDPLDWGLGVQLNTRPPSWMGTRTSPRTFGHFGGSGTFLWVDPEAQVVCVGSHHARVRRVGEGSLAALRRCSAERARLIRRARDASRNTRATVTRIVE